MLRKRIHALLLAAIMAVSMTACGGSTAPADSAPASETPQSSAAPSESAAPEASTAASGDKVALDVWHYFTGEKEVATLQGLLQKHAEDAGVDVTVTYVTREDLLKQYTMGALSGELPDVGMVDNPDHASFAAMGVFQDITDLLDATGDKEKYFEGPLKSCTYEGRIYGLPNNSNCLAFFINNTMFEEKGLTPPTTWDEMLTVSEQLGDLGSGVYPFAMSAMNDEEGTFQFMPWFISAGGSLDNLAGAETVHALDFLKTMIDKGYMSQDVINFKQSDVTTQFINGLAAMMLNGPWVVPTIEADAPDLDYSVVLVPKDQKYASVLGGENFAVCAGAPLQESFELLHYLCSEQVAADFCAGASKFPPRSDSITLKDVWTDDPVMKVFGEQLEYAMPRGPHPRWPEISKAMSTALTESLTGVKSPQDALNEAAATYDKIMSE